MAASVVSIMPATLAACSSAMRTTLAGSMTPALRRSSYVLGGRVEAERALARADLLDHDRALDARVLRDLAQGLLEGAADEAHARGLVARRA